jgi:hypothetical protein
MIHAMLCSPAMRDGLTPRFEPIDKFLDDGCGGIASVNGRAMAKSKNIAVDSAKPVWL